MGAQDKGLWLFVREHMLNVTRSLYCCDGTDENPIDIDDTIEQVVAKMADGVYRNGHPELLDHEVTSILWGLKQQKLNALMEWVDDAVRYAWPTVTVMIKEIGLFGDDKPTEESVSKMLDCQPWDVKDRTSTEEGVRLMWVGVVLRKLAITARQTESRNQGNDNEQRLI